MQKVINVLTLEDLKNLIHIYEKELEETKTAFLEYKLDFTNRVYMKKLELLDLETG